MIPLCIILLYLMWLQARPEAAKPGDIRGMVTEGKTDNFSVILAFF